MAFDDYDDIEQGEQVRKWIRENGVAVIIGVVLALVLIFGYRQWKAHTANVETQAAAQFAVVQNAVQADKKDTLTAALGNLQKNFAKSPYAAFASAEAAEYYVGKNELKPAATNLQWAVAHTDHSALDGLFRLRLARVLLAEGDAQQALTTVAKVPAGDFAGVTEELRGDALLKLGKTDAARTAYKDALTKMDKDAPERNAVQMKLDNLTQPQAASTTGKAP